MTKAQKTHLIHQLTIPQFEAMFPNEDACRAYLTANRWPDGVVKCPRCNNEHVYVLESRPHHWQVSLISTDVCKAYIQLSRHRSLPHGYVTHSRNEYVQGVVHRTRLRAFDRSLSAASWARSTRSAPSTCRCTLTNSSSATTTA